MSRALSPAVTRSPEAAARVVELGFQRVVEELITEALDKLPALQSIHLSLVPSGEMDDIPWLVLECCSERPEREARDALVAWYTWRADHLPFDVGRHFMLEWIEQKGAHAG